MEGNLVQFIKLMDPLTLAATAIAATIMTKFWEKTGEKLGEKVFTESEKFLGALKKKSPETVIAIKKVPEQPLDYGKAVLEVEALTKTDLEVSEIVKTLALAVTEDPNPKLAEIVREIVSHLKTEQPTVQNFGKLAEKIGLVIQGGTVSIQSVDVN